MRKNISRKSAGPAFYLAVALMTLCLATFANAVELNWPREIQTPEAEIVMYQPQLESFKSNRLTARAAVSVTRKGEAEPVFGAVWMEARVSTDRDTRVVTLLDIDVPQTKFPDVDPAKVEKLTALLEAEIPKWEATISLDRLLTMLDLVEKEKQAAENLKSTPPKIIFSTHPAVLVTIDGDPLLGKVEDSDLMRVLNTPFFIVLEPKTKLYYLQAGTEWMVAPEVVGPWKSREDPPASVLEAAKLSGVEQQAQEQPALDRMPQVIVSTEPAELIVTEGEPQYATLTGTDLLYVSNTESDVFLQIGSQRYFVLLSGRWFTSASLAGDWSFAPADKLPGGFAGIPPGSAKGHVLAQVAGTQQAKEAILDTYIPQTATVKRSEAKVVVVYDGDPKFVKIEDTDMYYAVNTAYSVIKYGNYYYCCHDGIWFVASSPLGPWAVCVAVPQVIYTVPPSCPVYHVKYVYVYSYTPEVVYVGYTPGYVGCYVYGGTVVYGTGYVYHGWHHVHYYPRPATWGVAVRYNPHTGNWGVAVGRRGGYGGWRVGYRDVDIDIDRNINVDRNVYGGRGGVAGPGGRYDPRGVRDPRGAADPRGARDPRGAADRRSPTRANNVYANRDGSVNRRTDQGWQKRDRGGWSDRKGSTTQLDRQSSARQRGTDRTNQYNRSRSAPSRRGGGRGGRRR
ncbi:MAG: carbohydrate-binding family V/XII [Planctomycetota bacterium]